MTIVRYRSRMPVSRARLFAFHCDVANLPHISPPFPPVTVEGGDAEIVPGAQQLVRVGIGPFVQRWRVHITRVEPDRLIEDVQAGGPFRQWRHQHRMADAPRGSQLTDVIGFRMLPTPAGLIIDRLLIRPALWGMLWWRHRRTRQLLSQ